MAYTGTFQNYPISGKNFGIYCEYSYEQDVAENSSTITLKTYLAYATLQVGQRSDSYAAIDNDTTTFTAPAIDDLSGGTNKRLINTKTLKVYHNNDGTKSCTLSASWRFSGTYSGTYVNRITAQTTISLHTIDRLAVVNSVQDLIADTSTPLLSFNVSIKNAFHTHKVQLLGLSDTVLYETDLSSVSGETSFTLPSETRTTILKHMANYAEIDGKVKVSTYKGGSLLGNTEKSLKIKTTEENSKPTISSFNVKDGNNILDDNTNKYFVQRLSNISVTVVGSIANNYSKIKKYYAKIGGVTISSSRNNLNFLGIDPKFNTISGEQTLTAWVEDSRGYIDGNKYTIDLEIIPYQAAEFTNFEIFRVNGVEESIHAKIDGRYSPVQFNGEDKNRLLSVSISANGQTENITESVTVSGGSFSVDTILSQIKLNAEKDFIAEVNVTTIIAGFGIDNSQEIVIPKGKPLLAFRREKIGLNNNEPKAALDVIGGCNIDGGTVYHSKNLYFECGTVDISPSYADSEYNETINFSEKFPTLPVISLSVQARTSLSQSLPLPFITNRGTNFFTFGIFPQKANQSMRIHWIAVAKVTSSTQTLGEVEEENIEKDENL